MPQSGRKSSRLFGAPISAAPSAQLQAPEWILKPPTPPISRARYEKGSKGSPAWQRYLKWAAIAIVIIGAAYFTLGRGNSKAITYTTQDVVKGDLTVTVTATGNLEPRNQVEIGSELSGIVNDVNVDVNAEVKTGQVLAKLDTTRLKAQVLQAESSSRLLTHVCCRRMRAPKRLERTSRACRRCAS